MMWRRSRQGIGAAAAIAAMLACSSCGQAVRQGQSPAYLVLDQLLGASGARPTELSNTLAADVITNVRQTINGQQVLVPTIFEDKGEIRLRLALKNPGDPSSPFEPSDTNAITVNRYRVTYVRSDGRALEGIDVPYAFDGAVTGTVTKAGLALTFVLVRAQAKMEAPLLALRGAGGSLMISTIAYVTFYGVDQAGNAVTVMGQISVNFADWGDPQQ